MKTPLLILSGFWLLTSGFLGDANAQVKVSDLQSITSFQSGDLIMIARPGDKNYKMETVTQLPSALGLGTAAFTASSAYDAAGTALAATNGLGGAAFKGTNAFDLAGTAIAATNGLGSSAFKNTNTFDLAGSWIAATNGYPWGVLYDAAGAATAATNAFRDGRNLTNLLHSSTVSGVSGVSVALTQNADGSTNYGLTVTAGGSGTVTSVGLSAPSGMTVSGSPVTGAGTLTLSRTAGALVDYNSQNLSNLNSIVVGAGSITNTSLMGSTLLKADANKKTVSVANPSVNSVATNDSSGNLGYKPLTDFAMTNQLLDASALGASGHVKTGATTNLITSEDATGYTNTVSWTHEGTTTNITATFNGTIQTFTCTNGPSIGQNYFIHYAGANGSISYRFSGSSYNNLNFDYQPKWLTGSNSVITNGVLTLTSYGGTNATQIEAAMRENQ